MTGDVTISVATYAGLSPQQVVFLATVAIVALPLLVAGGLWAAGTWGSRDRHTIASRLTWGAIAVLLCCGAVVVGLT